MGNYHIEPHSAAAPVFRTVACRFAMTLESTDVMTEAHRILEDAAFFAEDVS